MKKSTPKFIDCLENCKFRYIDQTGLGRVPISSNTVRTDLNLLGYEAYQTVNGFSDCKDNTKEQCTNINAIFCDIDGRKNLSELEDIKKILEPSFIIETKRGWHVYYLLDEVIYKNEVENWNDIVDYWEKIEASMVKRLNADPAVKDVTRILRQVDTFYWKKTGEQFKEGIKDAFKIKGVHKNLACRYSLDQLAEVFPVQEISITFPQAQVSNKRFADSERENFYRRVNEEYPIEERDSFKRLISGHPDTLPPNYPSRNQALLITGTLMRQTGWSKEKALKLIEKIGWHGIEKERGGSQEIMNTLNSAFQGSYTYTYKNDLISFNMSSEEQMKIQLVYTKVAKERKDTDKVRFSNYEREILIRHPYLRKNEVGLFFNYDNGVYKIINDQEISDVILNGLFEDMLWNFRTQKNVSDKVACLLSVIPMLEITNDHGYIANVKNGLLNIYTGELQPHTPNFVSLIQYQIEYNPDAKCPVWEGVMSDWMEGDEKEEKTKLLQQFSGYCLSSSMVYDKALFLVGDGGNGKSTFVDTIAMILGSNAVSHIDLEALYGQYGMKGLVGKRMNVIEEVHGNYYQSNKLKKVVSGEQVTIDIKYKDQFTFRPQAKFVFAVNQMPRVDDTSTATERRICAVMFKNNFRNNPNKALRSDFGLLAKELSGIFNWMLVGARDLHESKNFIVTQEQIQMLSEYRQENSSVEGFIGECLTFAEGNVMTVRQVYDEYKKWCGQDGRKFKSNIAFTKEMKAFGKRYNNFEFMERTSGHDGAKFEGIAMKTGWKDHLATQENEIYGDYNKAF